MSARRNCLLFLSYVFRIIFFGEKSGKVCCAWRAIFIIHNNYIKMIETSCAQTASTPERCKAEWLSAYTLGIRLPVDFANFYQIAQSTTSGTESYSEGFNFKIALGNAP